MKAFRSLSNPIQLFFPLILLFTRCNVSSSTLFVLYTSLFACSCIPWEIIIMWVESKFLIEKFHDKIIDFIHFINEFGFERIKSKRPIMSIVEIFAEKTNSSLYINFGIHIELEKHKHTHTHRTVS